MPALMASMISRISRSTLARSVATPPRQLPDHRFQLEHRRRADLAPVVLPADQQVAALGVVVVGREDAALELELDPHRLPAAAADAAENVAVREGEAARAIEDE